MKNTKGQITLIWGASLTTGVGWFGVNKKGSEIEEN